MLDEQVSFVFRVGNWSSISRKLIEAMSKSSQNDGKEISDVTKVDTDTISADQIIVISP